MWPCGSKYAISSPEIPASRAGAFLSGTKCSMESWREVCIITTCSPAAELCSVSDELKSEAGRVARRAARFRSRFTLGWGLTQERFGAKRQKLMPCPLRILVRRDDVAIAHVNDAIANFRRFRVVGDHQHGLAELLVGFTQHAQDDLRV